MKRKLFSIGILTLTFAVFAPFSATSAHAWGWSSTNPYNTLTPEIREIPLDHADLTSPLLVTPEPIDYPAVEKGSSLLNLADIDLDKVILIGEKIVEIIKAGQPNANVTRNPVSVLPAGATSWTQLLGWQAPKAKGYQLILRNAYGINMVDVKLKVIWNYGGSVDGKGNYIANVTFVPLAVNVKWGINLDLWMETRDALNVSKVAGDPIAGLGFDIRYRAKSWFSDVTGGQDYFITGTGDLIQADLKTALQMLWMQN